MMKFGIKGEAARPRSPDNDSGTMNGLGTIDGGRCDMVEFKMTPSPSWSTSARHGIPTVLARS